MKNRFLLIFSILMVLNPLFAQEKDTPEIIVSDSVSQNSAENPVNSEKSSENVENSGNLLDYLEPRPSILFYPGPDLNLQALSEAIGWITNNELYFITNKNAMVLNHVTNTREDIPVEDGRIIYAQVAHNTMNGVKELYTLTNKNEAGIRTLPLSNQFPQKNYESDTKFTATAYSPNGLYIAFGDKNGQVSLGMQLQYSKQIYHSNLFLKTSEITQLAFNQTSDKLLCVSKDGKVDIWDLKTNDVISKMIIPPKKQFPVYFSGDSNYIISADSKSLIIIRDLEGHIKQEIPLPHKMRSYTMSHDGKYLFELGTDNNIYVFRMETLSMTGYIPYFSNSIIADYDFSQDYEKILITHKDGLVFILNTRDVYLDPDSPQPKLGKGTFSGGSGTDTKNYNSDSLSSDMYIHNIDLRLNVSKPDDPYISNITGEMGYIYKPMFQPFYYGGTLDISMCFPDPSFPYAYVNLETGKQIPTPYLLGPKLTGIVGVYFKPFFNDIGIFAEAKPSISLYSFYFPEYGFMDKYPSFAVELQTGICWKQFLIFAGGVYDYRLGVSFSGGIGTRIRIGGG